MSNNSYYNDAWRIINEKNQSLVSNYSMQFDGTNDFVNISNPTQLTDDFTIAAWIYPTRVNGSYEMIYTQGTTLGAPNLSPYFAIQDTKLHVYITGIYETGLNFITADEWQHVAVTRTSGVLNLYRNGVEYNGNRPTQNGTINNNSDGVIGKWYNNTHHFKGKIDQVCVFDYALPATGTNSVATLYGGGTAVTNPMSLSPIAYYQLGDQTASNNTTEPTPAVQSYLVPNNSLQDYVFFFPLSNTARISVPSRTNSSTATISLWVNYDSLGIASAANVVIGGGSTTYWPYLQNSSGKFHFYINTPSSPAQNVITTVDVVLNKWFHIALSDDGTNTKAYINGVPQGTMTSVANAVFDTIGAYSGGGFSTDGRMSNVAYWQNTNLSDAQILSIYNNGVPNDISSLNPTSWWKLNAQDTFNSSTSVWTINDYGSSGTDGTSVTMDSSNLVQSNLQHTSGYSPYALSLDRADGQRLRMSNGMQLGTNKAVSMWIKFNNGTGAVTSMLTNSSYRQYPSLFTASGYLKIQICEPSVCTQITTTHTIVNDVWFNLIISGDGTTATVYVNGQNSGQGTDRTPSIIDVGNYTDNAYGLDGDLSNLAVWQSNSLTSAEATEIFNSGRPSNLNNFSGTKPTAWWQLGSNSSFNATTSQWTCLDEIGTNNISTATNDMSEDAITNGVGYSANGLGTSSIEIIGDAPYSTANGISENMDVLDRTTDVPS